ncbi:MAG TPA: pitrilysin family protein [Gemmatimonadales bacterium]|nr:pitrilysin family protein [Gemmatimonadales bacterium]
MTATPSRSPFTVHRSRLWTVDVRREVLPNGLTILIQPDHSAPVVSVVTHVKAGFFDEPDHWTGISHVLEHMFFKGTPRRGVGAIARETKTAGGYLNAGTGYDHTTYFTVLPSSGLAAALDIQSDALRNSVIDSGELTRELQVIIQEAKRKLDTPPAVAHETLHELMFDRHRIRRWRIGREEQLAGLTRDDLWSYYTSRYVPERTIVAITGSLEVSRALELARAAYADWPARPGALDPSPEEPPRREVRARTLRGDVANADLVLGWRAVPPLHDDAPALDLAAAVLSAGRGSWLYRALREEGIVTSVSAHNYAPTEIGVFSISADLAPEKVPLALERIAESVSRLALLGPGPDEMERARTLVRARWARRMESMEGKGAALAAAEALDEVSFLDREYEALGAVAPDEVRAVAARYLQPDNVSAIAYLPDEEGVELTAPLLERAFAVTALRQVSTRSVARPKVPQPAAITGRTEAEVLHTQLPGVDLLVRRKPGVPLVTLGVYVPRADFDPPSQAGLGALTVRSSVRGAGDLEAAGLAFAFERLGGTLISTAASDWLGFGTTVLSEHVGEAALLLDLVFTSPMLRDPEVTTERGLMVLEAEQVADDMFRYPFQLAFAEAFGDAGYGLPVGGLPETLPNISVADVRAWHRRALLGVRRVVVAVGDVDPQETAATLAGVFASRSPLPDPILTGPLAWTSRTADQAIRIVEREKAQSALAMAFPGPGRRDPDRVAAEVWAAVASGLGGRMFEALRDRRSLAYTVLASSWQKGRGGALVTYIATSPEREDEARTAMLEELRRFTREPVSAEELEQAVNYLSGQAEVGRQSGSALAGEILEAWLSGNGLGDLENPGAAFRAVSADDVLRVASGYLQQPQKVEGVVRGTGISSPVGG